MPRSPYTPSPSRAGAEPGVSGTEFPSLSPWGLWVCQLVTALGLKLTSLAGGQEEVKQEPFFFFLKRIDVCLESDSDINSGE